MPANQHDDFGSVDFWRRIAIADRVGEALRQQITAAAQCLHVEVAVVDLINVAAVGENRQRAVQPGDHRAADIHCYRRPRIASGAGFDERDGQIITVGIGVIGRHVTRRVDARRGVANTALFGSERNHVLRHGWIVDAAYGNHQLRGVGQPGGIGNTISEELGQRLA
ncbi:hypothetical protein D3C84_749500 [compost metagenome]